MDSHYLQHQRFLLQKRVRRLNSANHRIFHNAVVRFWGYLQAHPLFSGVLAKWDAEYDTYTDKLEAIRTMGSLSLFDTEQEQAAFTFRLVQHYVRQTDAERNDLALAVGKILHQGAKFHEALDEFRDTYLEALYEALDESLDQQAAVLSLLVKYKRHVEWFERENVRALVSKGERKLAPHLYAYLFNQGLDFHIEPQTASGLPDLVCRELVADAKIFDGDSTRGTRYIKHGFHQLLTYA